MNRQLTADATARREALATLALATSAELSAAVAQFGAIDVVDLKPPQVGLVMLRGRIGGDGNAFNLGEATVAHAVVRLPSGVIGYGQRLGRDADAARYAAILDAVWQDPAHRSAVENRILDPVRRRCATAREQANARTAATRVDFFTLAREAT